MRKTYRRRRKPQGPRYRSNQGIRVPEVRLIGAQGESLGTMSTREALAMAQEQELDSVEVSPKAQPPVCRLIDYGQLKYKQEKLKQKSKAAAKRVEIKGLRITFKISQHDLEIRKKKAEAFLKKGHKVKIEMMLRGRERAHLPRAFDVIKNFAQSMDKFAEMEGRPLRQGGRISLIIKARGNLNENSPTEEHHHA